VRDGARVRVAGEGDPGAAGGRAGDLYLRVQVLPHARFERQGDDLTTHVEVALTTAVLGGEAAVTTLAGTTVRLKVPATTQNGQKFRLKGHGMPVAGKADERGDLYVVADVQLPRALTPEERDHYEALARLAERDVHAKAKATP
jgi:DnaJ-class molecular chaperone